MVRIISGILGIFLIAGIIFASKAKPESNNSYDVYLTVFKAERKLDAKYNQLTFNVLSKVLNKSYHLSGTPSSARKVNNRLIIEEEVWIDFTADFNSGIKEVISEKNKTQQFEFSPHKNSIVMFFLTKGDKGYLFSLEAGYSYKGPIGLGILSPEAKNIKKSN